MVAPPPPPSELDIGLPVEEGWVNAALFCTAAKTIVVVVGERGHWCEQRVFVRAVDEHMYRKVQLPGQTFGVMGLVVSDAEPCAYVMLHQASVEQDGSFQLEKPLFRVHLPTGVLEELPVAQPPGARVRQLLSYSDSTRLLNVVVAVPSATYSDAEPDYDFRRATYDPRSGETSIFELMHGYSV